ncbi:MAG: hypothetical protein RL266_1714 [Bacteroidota bacterium]
MTSSVRAQTFGDFEHIIVDDGSTDGTEDLISQISDSRIRYIKQENQGRSAARNTGIKAARGRYVCFLDSDDVWTPEHLGSLKTLIDAHPEPAYFLTGLIWFFDDGRPEEQVVYRPRHLYETDCEYVITNQFAPNCVCLHASVAKRHLFNEKLYVNEDLELWARITAEFPVFETHQATAKLRVHDGNTSHLISDSLTPRKQVLNMVLGNPGIAPHLSKTFIKDRKRGFDEVALREYQASGKRWKFIWSSLKFIFKYPNNPTNRAKLVDLLYNLPGGRWLKRQVG